MSLRARHNELIFMGILVLLYPAGVIAAKGNTELTRAQTCSEVRARLTDQIIEHLLSQRSLPERSVLEGRRFPGTASKAGPAREQVAADQGPGHHTGTNNQVVGVDEADRVKTDGKFIFTISGQDLVIVRSWPPSEADVVSRFTLGKEARPARLFLNGDKLLIFSALSGNQQNGGFSGTRATLLDIGDRHRPRLIAHVDLEGSMLQGRMIGSHVFVVSQGALKLPAGFWKQVNTSDVVWYGNALSPAHPKQRYLAAGSRALLRGRVVRALAAIPVTRLLPAIRISYAGGLASVQRSLHRCSDLYFPATGGQLGLLSLTHLSLDGGPVQSTGLMASGWQVYASEQHLYVAAAAQDETRIHRFRLGTGQPGYEASGQVAGQLLNQFSMDEHRDHLRVATTQSGRVAWAGSWRRPWRRPSPLVPSSSNIFVLKRQGAELKIVGAVRGLAPGERIYAARMMGDRGYVVTFRRTDPLYTVDLTDPKKPVVMGELKVPGFSSYIHPLGDGKLLTVGQDADEQGRVRGAHLQIFDVSDLKNPRRTAHHRLTWGHGSSSSQAQWDHHAFTFDPRSGMLALPLTVHHHNGQDQPFNGVILVQVSQEHGFRQMGAVAHADLAQQALCQSGSCSDQPGRYWNTPVQRSIFMDSYLYTLSAHGLKVHSLPWISPVRSLLI